MSENRWTDEELAQDFEAAMLGKGDPLEYGPREAGERLRRAYGCRRGSDATCRCPMCAPRSTSGA